MEQKFFTNTIQSKFIKNLLLNTSLPIVNSIQDDDYIISGFCYLYGSYIIKCTKSGYIYSQNLYDKLPDEDKAFYDEHRPEYEIIRKDFKFGREYTGLTKIFKSSSNYYDSETHKYLGEYLRFYRDIFHTNLMPFYNCFNGVYTTKFFINENDLKIKETYYDTYSQGTQQFNEAYHNDSDYKIIQIPIKFNKKYTIALDCDSKVLISPCFVRNNQLVQVYYGGKKVDLTNTYVNGNIIKFDSMYFKYPVLIDTQNTNQDPIFDNETQLSKEQIFQQYERDLYLLIQLPKDNTSSVVVLEGNYSNVAENNIFDVDDVEKIDDNVINELLISKLSLLQLNDQVRYPFADRLIEYLLWNVIDNNEDIGQNVIRIQDAMTIDYKKHFKGVYDNYLRSQVFDEYKQSKYYVNKDINGYVDKDTEMFIMSGGL